MVTFLLCLVISFDRHEEAKSNINDFNLDIVSRNRDILLISI